MAFGFNSYSKPTPNRINILFDCIGAMLNIIAGFFIGAGFINHNVSDVVAGTINLLLAPMVPVIKRLFSVDVEPGQKTVPIADVKVMEEKMTAHNDKGLLAYWPQLIGMVSLVFGAGVVYGKFGTMDEKQRAMELRQDRHLEMMQAQEKRIIELEKRTEYYRGLREGRNERTGILTKPE